MGKIEVLVATMNQSDLLKYYEMNIQTDALFANQSNTFESKTEYIENNRIKMITSDKYGVGRNRNIGLLYSSNDICLLSDDDVVYVEGYEKKILGAFESLPEADIIIFNVETIGNNNRRINKKISKVNIFNFLNYGAVRIAFRRSSILEKNIWFSLLFGGGAIYSAGEDSLFLRESLRKKLKIFCYPTKIADVKQETSTWFNGYNEKYFYDKGAFLAASFPILKYFFIFYFTLKFNKFAELGYKKIFTLMIRGIKGFQKGKPYSG